VLSRGGVDGGSSWSGGPLDNAAGADAGPRYDQR